MLWRGGHQATGTENSLLDEYPFDSPLYRELAKGKPLPDFITGRVVGNPVATREQSASKLAAKGLGSSTFLPRPSQLVQAKASWNSGRWTLVLRRPLAASPDGGLTLATGDSCSIAFALWDGAARDRGGQKLVSIWNDLKLE